MLRLDFISIELAHRGNIWSFRVAIERSSSSAWVQFVPFQLPMNPSEKLEKARKCTEMYIARIRIREKKKPAYRTCDQPKGQNNIKYLRPITDLISIQRSWCAVLDLFKASGKHLNFGQFGKYISFLIWDDDYIYSKIFHYSCLYSEVTIKVFRNLYIYIC